MHSSLYHNFLQAKQNDPVAFKIILQYFIPQIRSYSRKTGSEDTMQSLILFLLELIRRLPAEKDYFKEDKILLAYISKSLRNKFIELSKKQYRIASSEIPLIPDFALTDPKNFEISIWLLDLLKTLKANERRILILIYFYGYSVKEIAAAKRVSVQPVNQLKNRALGKIRKQLIRAEKIPGMLLRS